MTELDRLLERNRRALDLKDGLERGVDHDELRRLIGDYSMADTRVLCDQLNEITERLKAAKP